MPAPLRTGIRDDHTDTMLTDLVVLDAADIAAGPVATVRLPFRVRPGTHGTWMDTA